METMVGEDTEHGMNWKL